MDIDDSVVGLTKDKMQKVSDFRTHVNISLCDMDMSESFQLDQAVKYLRATKFDVSKSLELYHNYQRHRETYNLSHLKTQGQILNGEIRTRKLEVLGTRDAKGAQLLLYTASRHTPKSPDCQTVMQLFFLIFDQISDSTENQSKGFSFLLDLRDTNMTSFDPDYASSLFSVLQNGYPLYLNTLYVIEAPSWFKQYHGMSPFKSLQHEGKIKLCNNISSLRKLLPVSSLPVSLGGTFTPGISSFASSNELTSSRQISPTRNVPVTPPPRKNKPQFSTDGPSVSSNPDDSQESLDDEQPVPGSVNEMKKIFHSSPTHKPVHPKPKPKPKGPKPVLLPSRVNQNGDGTDTANNKVRMPILPPAKKEKPTLETIVKKSKSVDDADDEATSRQRKDSSEGRSKPSILGKLRLKTTTGATTSNKQKEDLKSPEKPTVAGLGSRKPLLLFNKVKPPSSNNSSHDSTQDKAKETDSKKSGRHLATVKMTGSNNEVEDPNPPPSYSAPSPPTEDGNDSSSQKPHPKPAQYVNINLRRHSASASTTNGIQYDEPVSKETSKSAGHQAKPYKVMVIAADPTPSATPPNNNNSTATPKVKLRDRIKVQPNKEGSSSQQETSTKEESRKLNSYENVFFTKEEDEGECFSTDFEDDASIYENYGPDEGNRWMSVDELEQYVTRKGKEGLSGEYFKIKNEPLSDSSDVFRLAYNMSKNRYKDVVCYDSTRVVLEPLDGTEGSDYIHANYVNGFEKKQSFILTQGPLKRTVVDYWRLLWEKEVFVVVMTTKCVEMAKLKCAQYWPKEEETFATFGNVSVKVLECQKMPSFELRKLSVHCQRENRVIMHYQFTAWPDYGVPDTGKDVVELLYQARGMQERFREFVANPDRFPIHGPPVVIHCSAGIGRSGTFCALDYCIDELRVKGRVNIQQCVRNLRQQRAFAIQTDEQYRFCYDTVLEYGRYLKDVLKF